MERVRTGSGPSRAHLAPQHAHAFDLDLDDVSVRKLPTPSGVPVSRMSPGSSVMKTVMYSISVATPKTISEVDACWRISPFSRVRTIVSLGSRSVAIQGPIGADPSNPFARAHWSSVFWRSRSVTSLAHV